MKLEIVVKEPGEVQVLLNTLILLRMTEEEAIELKLSLEKAVSSGAPFKDEVEVS